MKSTFILLLSFWLGATIHAQDLHDQKIKESFSDYKSFYLSVDRTALLNYVHPHIIQVSGGPDFVLEDLTLDYNMYASSGLVVKNITLKQGSKVIQVGEELQAMFPYERQLMKAKEELVEKGFFLVVSQDKGETWTFTDMKKYDEESIKIFVPNYNERFNIYLNSSHN